MRLSGKGPATEWVRTPVSAVPFRGGGIVYGGTMVVTAGGLLLSLCQVFGLWPALPLPEPLWAVCAFFFFVLCAQVLLLLVIRRVRRAALRARRADQLLTQSAPDMMARIDLCGRIRYVSPACNTLLGYLPQTLNDVPMERLLHTDDLMHWHSLLDKLAGGTSGGGDMRLMCGTRRYIWADLRCNPLRDEVGHVCGAVVSCRDISARKAEMQRLNELSSQAESASSAKSRYLANMSHELRTPLNAILGFSEVLSQELFGPLGAPRYLEYAQLIHESGTHLLEMVNSVLDLSKIEAGKFEILCERFDLAPEVEMAVHFVKIAAERAGVSMLVDIDPATDEIMADRRAVRQMLINLFSNAIKFTPAGGEVRLTTRRRGQAVEIAVSDTGAGISPADLKRLGQPFEQTRAGGQQEGTGLGLSLVKAFMSLHGGDAVLQSVQGVGTSVRLVFPNGAIERPQTDTSAVQPMRGVA